MISIDTFKTAYGENIILYQTDIEGRKRREWTGLDTPVIYAVNNECYKLFILIIGL